MYIEDLIKRGYCAKKGYFGNTVFHVCGRRREYGYFREVEIVNYLWNLFIEDRVMEDIFRYCPNCGADLTELLEDIRKFVKDIEQAGTSEVQMQRFEEIIYS